MKLTKEVFAALDACMDGYKFALKNDLINKNYDEVIAYCEQSNQNEWAEWLAAQKSTEAYVRLNGSIFTMDAYQVFDPQTGVHTRYNTEEEARQALITVAKSVLANHCPRVVRELSNENGDTTWVSTEMHITLRIE